MNQPALFRARQTWMHYIGGYYKSTAAFVAEARKQGISRRIPAQIARGMQFGDQVILLRWDQGRVQAFAEMQITGLVLDHEIAERIGRELQADGKAEYSDGGGFIQRACGSYMSVGTWRVNAELSDIVDRVVKIAEQKKTNKDEKPKVFIMVGGRLTEVYAEPILLSPAPKFTRGFIRANALTAFENETAPGERQVTAISDYRKAEQHRDRSRNGTPALLPA